MNKPKILRKLGEIDVNSFLDFIEENNIDFNTERNNYHNRPQHFHGCNSFFFIDEFKIIDRTIFNDFNYIFSKTFNLCEKIYGKGELYKMQLSKLHENGKIIPHHDVSLGFTFSHRIHIPLITNKNVTFTIDGNNYFFDTGEIIEINNLKLHSVENLGNSARLHLIFDYIGYEYSDLLKNKNNINYI